MIGSEGMTGSSFILGAVDSPFDVHSRLAGKGYSVRTEVMQTLVERSVSCRLMLLRYASVLQFQFAQNTLVYAQANKATRLARWLLMAFDRTEECELTITHDVLSET